MKYKYKIIKELHYYKLYKNHKNKAKRYRRIINKLRRKIEKLEYK